MTATPPPRFAKRRDSLESFNRAPTASMSSPLPTPNFKPPRVLYDQGCTAKVFYTAYLDAILVASLAARYLPRVPT